MNEPANFGTNDERPWNWPEDAKPYWSLHCPEGPLDDPAYRTSKCSFVQAPVNKLHNYILVPGKTRIIYVNMWKQQSTKY
jgi:hypothetical protein